MSADPFKRRKKHALQLVRPAAGIGLELGPLTSPLVSKSEGNIAYLDHLSTEGLKNKYADDTLMLEDIVEVDYVLKDSLKQTVNKQFDYVVASHVIEHIPEMVSWLKDVASVLKPNGILSLVIPDKRYTFDVMRHTSTPGEVIGAYLENITRSPSTAIYDHYAEARQANAAQLWNGIADYSKLPTYHNQKEALNMCKASLQGNYVDCHRYIFTPYSFFKILRSLINHGLITNYEVSYFHDTFENDLEFYVSLRKVRKSKNALLSSLPDLPRAKSGGELTARVNQLTRELNMSKKELDLVINSSSWRLTKPLRSLRAFIGSL
jgi:SAM-dependent methyltransferase